MLREKKQGKQESDLHSERRSQGLRLLHRLLAGRQALRFGGCRQDHHHMDAKGEHRAELNPGFWVLNCFLDLIHLRVCGSSENFASEISTGKFALGAGSVYDSRCSGDLPVRVRWYVNGGLGSDMRLIHERAAPLGRFP